MTKRTSIFERPRVTLITRHLDQLHIKNGFASVARTQQQKQPYGELPQSFQ